MIKPVAIFSKNITPSVLEDLRTQYGHLKIITVVAEADEYDIDNLSGTTIAFLVAEKIDVLALRDKSLSIAERMASVDAYCAQVPTGDDEANAELKRKQAMMLQMVQGIVTFAGDKYQFVVRRPDRGHIKMLMPLAGDKTKIDDFSDKAVKNLVVGGDIDALEDGLVFMGVVTHLQKMIAPAASFLSRA